MSENQEPNQSIPQAPAMQSALQNMLEDPNLASYVRRELTAVEEKAKAEREYLLSLPDPQKHSFILLRKEPNSRVKLKARRQLGKGAYLPTNPYVEALFLYDTNCTQDQILKKTRRGDVIIDYNFTDRAREDAKRDERIRNVISLIESQENLLDNVEKFVGIRKKMAAYNKTGKTDAVQPDAKTVSDLYKKVR